MMRRRTFVLLALLLACSDATRPSEQPFGGDYVLQSINGKPLPYTWTFAGGNVYTLRSYRFSIIPPKSWISKLDYSYTDKGTVVNRPDGGELGSYTFTESTGFVSLISQDQTTFFTGTVSGSTLTITENGDVWVFKR